MSKNSVPHVLEFYFLFQSYTTDLIRRVRDRHHIDIMFENPVLFFVPCTILCVGRSVINMIEFHWQFFTQLTISHDFLSVG